MLGEHKKAVEQAEKIEQEFVSLMTGESQEHTTSKRRDSEDRTEQRRKFASPSKLALVIKSYTHSKKRFV